MAASIREAFTDAKSATGAEASATPKRARPPIRPLDIFQVVGESRCYYQITRIGEDGIYARAVRTGQHMEPDGTVAEHPVPCRFLEHAEEERAMGCGETTIIIHCGRGVCRTATRVFSRWRTLQLLQLLETHTREYAAK